ncbi:MAG: carboxypeptidase-like regulatory domain-containing protein [Limnohabitans sp.]|nr:carboxypeptidase-like regulatory domain-containing protein [Limnohabitans sp.]
MKTLYSLLYNIFNKLRINKFVIKFIFSILVSLPLKTKGQQFFINGTVKSNHSGNAIPHASVVVKNKQALITQFDITDNNGKFQLTIDSFKVSDSIELVVSVLGFQKKSCLIRQDIRVYDFFLHEKDNLLDSVEVKTRVTIKSNGDTLRYNVNAFSREEDRSIGDVIKRIPGMSVAENGEISFNGKAISNLYIQGDDLMDGRYGLATKTISKETIKSIDVVQNFQPIQVLKDRLFTNDIALNLNLKDEKSVKINGQVTIGGGFPNQYDANMAIMLFNTKVKFLNTFKTNNSGIDYSHELNLYSTNNYLTNKDNLRPKELLSSATINNPDLAKERFYFNHANIINLNNLYNTKDTLQLRLNVHFFTDKNTFNFNSLLYNYLNTDTIAFSQSQQLLNKLISSNISFTLLANKSRNYISNKISFNFSNTTNYSNLNFNNAIFNQHLKSEIHNFSNDFVWIPFLKSKNIIAIKAYINYYNQPQQLLVNKGINDSVLNNGIVYKTVDQLVKMPSYFANVSASFTIGKKHLITKQYEIGSIVERQNLFSTIEIEQLNGSKNFFTGDKGNAILWIRNKTYALSTFSINKPNYKINLSLPIVYQSVEYKQQDYLLNSRLKNWIFNPSINAQVYINTEDFFSVNYNFKNNFGNITDIYRGLVLTDYRTTQSNNTELQETYNNGSGLVYHFKRAIKLLFANVGVTYNQVKANTIASTILLNNSQQTILIPFNNSQNSITANAEISKYIFKTKTKLNIKTYWSKNFYNQLINSEPINFSNISTSIIWEIDGKIGGNFIYNYVGNNTKIEANQLTRSNQPNIQTQFYRYDNRLLLGYSSHLFLLNIKLSHIYTYQQHNNPIDYLFTDALLRFNLKKAKADISIEADNIFNIKQYQIFSISSNQFSQNNYQLRGRVLLLKATFNF